MKEICKMQFWRLAAALLFVAGTAQASKPKPEDYQDGVLVSLKTVASGASCSTSGTATRTDSGADVSAQTDCTDKQVRLYTVQVANQTYVLRPASTKKAEGLAYATVGWSAILAKQSVLANQLPGTHFQIRSDADGVHIRLGKRESLYSMVAAQ